MNPQLEPLPLIWEDGLYDSKLEAQLAASVSNARAGHLPRDLPPAQPITMVSQNPTTSALETLSNSTLSQLMAGCGVAAIDGYLTMKQYAESKGLDLVELHHKGIDLQDLLSTLIIHQQKQAEIEGREAGARRWKR